MPNPFFDFVHMLIRPFEHLDERVTRPGRRHPGRQGYLLPRLFLAEIPLHGIGHELLEPLPALAVGVPFQADDEFIAAAPIDLMPA